MSLLAIKTQIPDLAQAVIIKKKTSWTKGWLATLLAQQAYFHEVDHISHPQIINEFPFQICNVN